VLVTGAAGFVGGHLIRRLGDDGAAVTALVSPRRPPASGQVPLDVRDVDAVARAVEAADPTIVFHLAGCATRVVGAGPDGFAVNAHGTEAILEAVRRAGAAARVVVASTDALTERLPEDDYERSKAAAEAAAACAREEREIDVVVARLANVYGPGDRAWHRLVPAAAAAAAAGKPFEPATPTAAVDLVHVDDAVVALARLGRHGGAPVQRVASGSHATVAAVVDCVQAVARGEAPPVVDVSPYGSSVPLVAGWTPQIALAPGLAGTVRWYLERPTDQGAD
jgi:nucleoside-diphosphate-sugar epimerase